MMLSKILSEATKARQVNKAIANFISDDIEDDDDIVMSLVDTDNANKPDSDDIDEDTLMKIFAVLDHSQEELGAEDLADAEITHETEDTITESTLNEMQANALILAGHLYEACTGKKGQDRDTTEFCDACGKADEACKSSEACKSEGDCDDEDDFDDVDDDVEDLGDDAWDEDLLADAYRV